VCVCVCVCLCVRLGCTVWVWGLGSCSWPSWVIKDIEGLGFSVRV